jgi:transcriptional regulator with XRE-family HTH domain
MRDSGVKRTEPSMATDKDRTEQRRIRFRLMLGILHQQGTSQQEVGLRTGAGPQYVSDVKTGRRALTELFARRLAQEFGVDHQWLLTGRGRLRQGEIRDQILRHRSPAGPMVLPVLELLVSGDPWTAPCWDGSTVELTGLAAAMAAERAVDPYVLRLRHGDRDGRLRVNDLVLISQAAEPDATLVVASIGGSLRLIRVGRSGLKRDLETGESVPPDTQTVGHCVAVVWGPL